MTRHANAGSTLSQAAFSRIRRPLEPRQGLHQLEQMLRVPLRAADIREGLGVAAIPLANRD